MTNDIDGWRKKEPYPMKARRTLLLLLTLVLTLIGAGGLWGWKAKRQYALDRQLIAALVHNDSKAALALVNAGADPNTHYKPSPAPTLEQLLNHLLHHSPILADYSATAFLFACGADGDSTNEDSTALCNYLEDVPLVQAMIAHGANCKARDTENFTALHYTVSRRRRRIALLLLEHGTNINAQDDDGYTPLMIAVMGNDLWMTRLLLDHHANVLIEDHGGYTALDNAIFHDASANIFRQLLAHGADPNHPDKFGDTLLMLAQSAHRPDLVALLRGKR